PVLSPFGFHIIRMDARKGDTLSLHHILVKIQTADSVATRLDRRADSLSKMASGSENGSKLDSAAKKLGLKIVKLQVFEDQTAMKTPAMFARGSIVPGLGQYNEAIGAAFALPVGAVSQPVRTQDNLYVLRVDKRLLADSTEWQKQVPAQRAQRLQQLRQQKIQMFLQDMRKAAKVDDRRKAINAAVRRTNA